jgi:hypothetical protein
MAAADKIIPAARRLQAAAVSDLAGEPVGRVDAGFEAGTAKDWSQLKCPLI